MNGPLWGRRSRPGTVSVVGEVKDLWSVSVPSRGKNVQSMTLSAAEHRGPAGGALRMAPPLRPSSVAPFLLRHQVTHVSSLQHGCVLK